MSKISTSVTVASVPAAARVHSVCTASPAFAGSNVTPIAVLTSPAAWCVWSVQRASLKIVIRLIAAVASKYHGVGITIPLLLLPGTCVNRIHMRVTAAVERSTLTEPSVPAAVSSSLIRGETSVCIRVPALLRRPSLLHAPVSARRKRPSPSAVHTAIIIIRWTRSAATLLSPRPIVVDRVYVCLRGPAALRLWLRWTASTPILVLR
jgi:hypothetical protein